MNGLQLEIADGCFYERAAYSAEGVHNYGMEMRTEILNYLNKHSMKRWKKKKKRKQKLKNETKQKENKESICLLHFLVYSACFRSN